MSGHVSVRMYDVGFGDSFLLTFPAPGRARKVLIDCGHHAAGPPERHRFDAVVDQILADVQETPGDPDSRRIDVVVCTHRHRDHVYGFERKVDEWKKVQVGEVWMPWTEHPTDVEARRIRDAQSKRALALQRSLAASGGNDAAVARVRHLLDNTLKNADAMATLHAGFHGVTRRRFLPEKTPGGLRKRMKPAALPEVTVHVLGPARDRDTIKDMEPPPGQSFLRLAEGAGGEAGGSLAGQWALSDVGDRFGKWFERTTAQGKALSFDPAAPLSPADPQFVPRWLRSLGLSWGDVQKIDKLGEEEPLAVAVAIEKAVNGTSLMLAFEVGRAMLLFPGDAQWGTWNRAVRDSRAVLERTTFLKVGHHGSHNASPRLFVEDVLAGDFQAMVSTRQTKLYKKIPRTPLLDRLREKQASPAVARSDDAAVAPPFVRVNPFCVEAQVPI